MAEQKTLTYSVASGSGKLAIQNAIAPFGYDKLSFQAVGDANVNGAVTVKLQETNVHGSGYKDVPTASAVVNLSTSEYVDSGSVNGAFLNFDIAVGAATLGIITFIVNYK